MKMIKLSYFISSVTTPSFANPSFVERKHELVAVCQYKKKNIFLLWLIELLPSFMSKYLKMFLCIYISSLHSEVEKEMLVSCINSGRSPNEINKYHRNLKSH